MSNLISISNKILEDIDNRSLTSSTVRMLQFQVGIFVKMAVEAGFTQPGQDLFNYIQSLDLSPSVRKSRIHILRLIDAQADSRILDQKGFLLNEPDFLTQDEAAKRGKEAALTYPVPSGAADLLDVIGVALTEIQKQDVSKSTIGQYWSGWRRLYAYFYAKQNTTFDLELISDYRASVIELYNKHSISVSQKNNYIRTTDVLVEVCLRGFLDWSIFHSWEERATPLKRICCDVSDEIAMSSSLARSTIIRQKSEFTIFCQLADHLGIKEPGQEMYDTVISLEATKDILEYRCRVMRLIDAKADTRIIDRFGMLLNEPDFLNLETAVSLGHTITEFPVSVKSVDVLGLIGIALEELRKYQLSESTIGQYWKAWRRLFAYMYSRRDTSYDPELLDTYISDVISRFENGNINVWRRKIFLRSVNVLKEIAEKGHFDWKLFRDFDIECSDEELNEILNTYLIKRTSENLEKATIDLYSYCFRVLLSDASIRSVEDLKSLNAEKIQLLMMHLSNRLSVNSRSTVMPIIRNILLELWKDGLIEQNCSGLIMTPNYLETHLRPYIASESEDQFYKALEEAPCRTRAIVRIASSLGMREVDILSLKFSEIDWRNDQINICQKKTGTNMTYPLLTDVGNDLMDYILNERPEQAKEVPYVFVRHQAPYKKLTTAYGFTSKLLKEAEVIVENRACYGLHTLRHTLTHKLLKNKVPHQVITDILGHISKESDKPYMSMEKEMLRQCSLGLSLCGNKYWEGDDINDGH